MTGRSGHWQKQQLKRRRLLQGAALSGAGFATVMLISCGREEKSAAPTGAPSAKQPKRGGTLIRGGGQGGTVDTGAYDLDPHTDTTLKALGYRLIYQGLLGYHPVSYEVEPELAQRWEQPSQTEYILTLQPNVRWQNKPPVSGRPLTAEDVVFSLERARTKNPRFTAGSLLEGVKIEAVDRSRIKLTTSEPDAAFLAKLSGDAFLVLAPEVVEKAGPPNEPGKLTTVELAVGTGAFIVTAVREKISTEYVRNPDYWKPGLPYLDGIRSVHFNDNETAFAAFLGGQVDIVRIPGTEVKKYIAQQGPSYTPDWARDTTIIGMANPNTKVKPFDDARVTKALRLLIDHQEFNSAWSEVWFGHGGFATIFPGALGNWDLREEEYTNFLEWKQPKDQAVREALALLSAAGFSRANPLRFELTGSGPGTYNGAATELLQAQFRRLGQGVVQPVELRLFDDTAWQTIRAKRDYTYAMMTNAASLNEPDVWLNQAYRSGASRNYLNLSDSKLDAMIDKQRVIFDTRERKAAVRELVLYLVLYMVEHSPGIITSLRFMLNAVKPHVRDFAPEIWMNGRQYDRIWLDM